MSSGTLQWSTSDQILASFRKECGDPNDLGDKQDCDDWYEQLQTAATASDPRSLKQEFPDQAVDGLDSHTKDQNTETEGKVILPEGMERIDEDLRKQAKKEENLIMNALCGLADAKIILVSAKELHAKRLINIMQFVSMCQWII